MKNFVKPKALKPGDVIGIFAPSSYVTQARFGEGVRLIESWGLKVRLGKHIYDRVEDFMAGTTEARAEDFRKLIFDDEVAAIWAAEGGYAATDIRWVLGKKEIEHLKKKPKWLIGYSDVGILTNALFAKGIVSICGPNVWGLSYWKKESQDWLKNLLFGGELVFPTGGEILVKGRAEGRLLATNIDSLAASLGTHYDPILNGDDDLILMIEEWKYSLSTLQRQFEAIFDHSRFERIKAIIFGRFCLPYEQSYPKWAKKTEMEGLIVEKLLLRKEIPLIKVDYFGHPTHWYYKRGKGKENNLAMISGIKVRLVALKEVTISCLGEVAFRS